jgi:RNase H-fold protein (predicted Holliday junction resolvase)
LSPRTVIAVDPGSAKCGIAVVTGPPLATLERAVVPTESLVAEIAVRLRAHPEVKTLVMGNGTHSKTLLRSVRAAYPECAVASVDETSTTLLARDRYRIDHPPKNPLVRLLLPVGLQEPPVPIDDYVAVILAERYLTGDMPEERR